MPEIPGICDDFKFQCPLPCFHCKMGESPWFQRICSSIIIQNMAGKFDAMRMVWLLKVWNIFLNSDFLKKNEFLICNKMNDFITIIQFLFSVVYMSVNAFSITIDLISNNHQNIFAQLCKKKNLMISF